MNLDYDIVTKRLYLHYDMKLVTLSIDRNKKSDNTTSSIHTAIHPATVSTVSDRNNTSSYHRSEHTGRFLHTFTGRQAIHCTKLCNIHHNQTAGT